MVACIPPDAYGLLGQVGRGMVLPSGRMGYGAAFRIEGQPGHPGSLRDKDLARRVLRSAVEQGAVLVDTADSYGPALSEDLVADALHPYPAGLLIATKGGVQRLGPGQTRLDGRPEQLRAACEASLRRLRVEAIGLYQLHWLDHAVPLSDQVGALGDLLMAGKIRAIGLCNVGLDDIAAAAAIAPIAAVQNRFGLMHRSGAAVAEDCADRGIAFIAHTCLAVLRHSAHVALAGAACRLGMTPAQAALAWVLRRLPNAIAIPGTLSLRHLAENMRARTLHLSAEGAAVVEAALDELAIS